MTRAVDRFSDRVDNYVRCRPSYPEAVLDWLGERLSPRPDVVDVGAGTGVFADQMLRRGWAVHAVEPNDAMRRACLERLGGVAGFGGSYGTAEDTGLPNESADLVTAAQAFHWFDPDAALPEFKRLLRPDGLVAVVWNSRETDTSPFLIAYEAFLRGLRTDYRKVDQHRLTDEAMAAYLPQQFEACHWPNAQVFDLESLKGRFLSSSYAPAPGQPGHAEAIRRLETIFAEHERDGVVEFRYLTRLYVGRPA